MGSRAPTGGGARGRLCRPRRLAPSTSGPVAAGGARLPGPAPHRSQRPIPEQTDDHQRRCHSHSWAGRAQLVQPLHDLHRLPRDGVVRTQDATAAGEGVLVEGAGLLVLTQRGQPDGEVVGRGEGVGVVLAQDPAAAGEGVLVERRGPAACSPSRARPTARLLAEARVSGWSSPRTRRRRVRVSSSSVAGLLVLAQRAQVDGEVVGRGEGVGVVVAQDPAAAGEGVLVRGRGPARARPARPGRRRGCWPR